MEYVNKRENTVLLWKLFSGRPVTKSRNGNPSIPSNQINIVRFYQFTSQSLVIFLNAPAYARKGL